MRDRVASSVRGARAAQLNRQVTSLPFRWSTLTLLLASIVSLASCEEWDHYRCVKQHTTESADSKRDKNAIAVLGLSKILRSRVREFLNASYPDLPVQDDNAGIRAGSLVFVSDGESDTVSYVPKLVPCPVA